MGEPAEHSNAVLNLLDIVAPSMNACENVREHPVQRWKDRWVVMIDLREACESLNLLKIEVDDVVVVER